MSHRLALAGLLLIALAPGTAEARLPLPTLRTWQTRTSQPALAPERIAVPWSTAARPGFAAQRCSGLGQQAAAAPGSAGAPDPRRPFGSLFLAGFECSTGTNAHGQPIDEIADTQHDRLLPGDYRRLRKAGIRGVRESMRWTHIDQGDGKYDFSSVEPFVRAGHKYGIAQIWDLFHYGYPKDVDIFSPQFVDRFAKYCTAAAQYLKPRLAAGQVPYFTLVNEISFFAWAGGDNAEFAPHARGRGGDLKRALVAAQIAGTNAIRAVLPGARIVHSEPLIEPQAPVGATPQQLAAAKAHKESSLEVFDMISGKKNPELGGTPRHLDIVGLNYYPGNQFLTTGGSVPLGSPQYVPLHKLLADVHQRYGRELMITETAQHRVADRAQWMRYTAQETKAALAAGVPLVGVTYYPVIGMKEWHNPGWLNMGLWDVRREGTRLKRVPDRKALAELQSAIRELDPANATPESRRIVAPAPRAR